MTLTSDDENKHLLVVVVVWDRQWVEVKTIMDSNNLINK
jgi:hypothetical protein